MKALSSLVLTLLLASSVVMQTAGRRVADLRGRNLIGGNKIVGNLPKGYEDFSTLWVEYKAPPGYKTNSDDDYNELLIPDKEGKMAVGGHMVFKGKGSEYLSYEYKTAFLIEKANEPIRLIFDTEVVEGVHYHFEGVFLERKADGSAQDNAHLEGSMTKFLNGKKVSENRLRFSPFIIME
jgi:hypothetical protein